MHWGKAKQVSREWYDGNLRSTIETYLRKFKITYCVDMDNSDYNNIASLHQKRDRQMIFIVGAIVWILEYVWDFLFSTPESKSKSKVKSKINSSANDVKPEPKKERRDKIE